MENVWIAIIIVGINIFYVGYLIKITNERISLLREYLVAHMKISADRMDDLELDLYNLSV